MDTLSVITTNCDDGTFISKWKWRQHGAKQPIAGEIVVHLDRAYIKDKNIIAELGAINHLLEDRQIHGKNRLGANIRIDVSFGAIRKALLKGALKINGKGDTEKRNVAGCAAFLSRKYFEAEIKVERKWHDEEPKSFERTEIFIGESFPKPMLHCGILGKGAEVTLHAMNRYIERIDKNTVPVAKAKGMDALPDKWWGTAWRWFTKVLQEGSNLKQVGLIPEKYKYYLRKYGPAQYLWFRDSGAVLIVADDHGVPVIRTVLQDKYANIQKEPVQVGQKVVPHHLLEAKRQFRHDHRSKYSIPSDR